MASSKKSIHSTGFTRLSTSSFTGSTSDGSAKLPFMTARNQDADLSICSLSAPVVRSAPGEKVSVASLLPPMFVGVTMGTIWAIHAGLHLLPLLQVGLLQDQRSSEDSARGLRQLIVSQTLTVMLVSCYSMAILTSPGTVPDTPAWKLMSRAEAEEQQVQLPVTREVKFSGKRRHCKWCLKYKPDRCHHCRVCNMCILKMDHHCPWIMNCVGFKNHKYFFLLVIYSVATLSFMGCSLLESVLNSLEQDMSTCDRFLLVFGLVLSIIMGTLMLLFLSFHVYLMFSGMTTIEFCEKNTVAMGTMFMKRRSYDRGLYANLKAVLGPRPLLWLLPICPPEGDGTNFPDPVEEADPEWTTTFRDPAMRM